jgi:hypothetical protein
MPDRPQSIPPAPPPPPPPIDLSEVTEGTRRALYDAVVEIHFNPTPEDIREARRTEEWYQRYGPDECRLTVLYLAGRWFAYWRIWDAGDDAPEDQEWVIVRVEPSGILPFGIEFYEV